MPDKKLTKDQQDRINELLDQWEKDVAEQVDTIQQPKNILDGPRSRKMAELGKNV
ncbi:MAG: hypothetical protein NC302_07855 [Bacteroidales bacterium]|nr:hypothetical protein [Bacteroidales bacterium]MCM1415555.1 hypothetical protein [bacterium]MCM1424083.1 hypothetical protein [bacterium]